MSVKKVGIVGAGVMGGEIAYVITQAGIPVVMKDIERKFLDTAIERVGQVYAMKVRRRRMSQEDMDRNIALVETTLDYAQFADVDFVIEAVPEILGLKQDVFCEIEKACPEGAILASNTSALSITAIAEKTARPENVAGMHFFNPVSMMRLVEVIRGKKTGDAAVNTVCALAEKVGKTPVPCADSAGFIVNRLLCTAIMEAIRCEADGTLERGAIDSALVKPDAGLPTGLFRMADQLGMDLIYKVTGILEAAFGERLAVPGIVKELYAAGNLGVKTGRGFYNYAEGTPKPPEDIDPEKRQLVVSRILTATVAEARRMLAEGVAGKEEIDTAMMYGALFKKPPFAYTAETGEAEMDARLEDYAKKYGPQFA